MRRASDAPQLRCAEHALEEHRLDAVQLGGDNPEGTVRWELKTPQSRRDGTPGGHSSEDFTSQLPTIHSGKGLRPLHEWAQPKMLQGTDTAAPGAAAGSAREGCQPCQTGSVPTGSARSSPNAQALPSPLPQEEGAESRAGKDQKPFSRSLASHRFWRLA